MMLNCAIHSIASHIASKVSSPVVSIVMRLPDDSRMATDPVAEQLHLPQSGLRNVWRRLAANGVERQDCGHISSSTRARREMSRRRRMRYDASDRIDHGPSERREDDHPHPAERRANLTLVIAAWVAATVPNTTENTARVSAQ